MLVYAEYGSTEEVCELGEKHEVTFYQAKRITETGETRIMDNGYEQRMTPLYTDAQGRIYHLRIEIDYHSNTWYLRDDGKHFHKRGLRHPARTLDGALIPRP
jgi:hypothetical protein